MIDILTLAIILFIGFIASFFGTIAGGGGGLITIPALAIFGLPSNVAVATNRFASVGSAASSAYKFYKEKKILFEYVIPFILISIVGSVIGAKILISINEKVLSKLIGFFILLLLPLILLKKDFGIKRKIVPKYYKWLGFFSYFWIAIYDAFFGAGAGIIITYLFVFILGLTYIEANALDKITCILNAVISTIIFAFYGLINYVFGITLFIGMIVGAYLGAHTAIKKGNTFVRIVFISLVVISAVKLIFF